MKQKQDGRGTGRPPAGDEGARYTKLLMAAVTRLRNSKQPRWSAERLAAEMAAVGVPWTRNAVVNLESGRRKHISMHEVLALALVLGVDDPAELIVPAGDDYFSELMFPVTPMAEHIRAGSVRAWFHGDPEPLRFDRRRAEGDYEEDDEAIELVRIDEDGTVRLVRFDELPENTRRNLITRLKPETDQHRRDTKEADDGGL